MKAGYKYNIAGTRYQIACNDNDNWYQRNTNMQGKEYLPWKPCKAPIITRGMMKANHGRLIRVENLTHEPFDLPKN
jgi:hypothetical protein